MASTYKIKSTFGSKLFDITNYSFMVILMFVMLYPFYNTLVVSFNDAIDSIRGNIYFWPREFTLYNYRVLFSRGTLTNAFFVSVARTVLSTSLNVFCCTVAAYVLSRKEYVLNKFLAVYIILTMYVNAGLIPTYFVYRSLGLINNFWVYVIPNALAAFNIIVIRTFINGLPESYAESARIDGAGDFRILVQIIMPLCKPILATVAVWGAVGSWNNWFDTFIYASSRQQLSTLQYEMMKLLSSSLAQSSAPDPNMRERVSDTITPNSIRAAITVVAAAPIICVYPFMQKYFVRGLNLGGVKG